MTFHLDMLGGFLLAKNFPHAEYDAFQELKQGCRL